MINIRVATDVTPVCHLSMYSCEKLLSLVFLVAYPMHSSATYVTMTRYNSLCDRGKKKTIIESTETHGILTFIHHLIKTCTKNNSRYMRISIKK